MEDLAAQLAIQGLLLRLARETDFGAVDKYLDCFDDDATMEIEGRPARVGRSELEAAASAGRAAGNIGPESGKYHIVIPGEVEVAADGATCESRFMFVQKVEQGVSTLSVGRYHDRFTNGGAGWKLSSRVIEFG